MKDGVNSADMTIHGLRHSAETEILACDPNLLVGLSRYDYAEDMFEEEVGDDWLKFHFQLRGAAQYAVPGEPQLVVEDLTAALVLHGGGITKTSCISAKPGFAVTVLCRPGVLSDRFGIRPASMPGPVARYLDHGDAAWFSEVGKMTPTMAMSVRALETMAFEGLMRNAYAEARGVALLCELWSQIACDVPFPALAPVVDERILLKVHRTRDHIDIFFAESLSVQRLARNVGTNETKLSQAFRTVFGMTIFEYVRSRRMEEARRLLREGNLSITEIAFEVGYEYSCNFSVAYKRHFGITPKEERRVSQSQRYGGTDHQ